jgi:hypothetical protein
MSRIRVGMQEADGETAHAVGDQTFDLAQDGRYVERNFDTAVGRQTFRNLATPGTRHQRRRHFKEQIIQLVFSLAADLQHIGKAGGGHQPGRRAFALDQGVGEQRRGMDHPANALRRDTGPLHQLR